MGTNMIIGPCVGSITQGALLNQTYDPTKDADVSQLLTSRSGVTLIDSIAAANATILLPHVRTNIIGRAFTITDNGALDVGTSDFTLCGWIKSNTDKSTNAFLVGKYVNSATVYGHYGIRQQVTTGYLSAYIKTTGELITITHPVDFTTMGWVFYRLDINQTTHKIRFFVNEIQVGTDVTYTGSFPALDNVYKFWFGGCNAPTTGSLTFGSANHYSDTYVFNKLLTTGEAATLYARGSVSGAKAHWPMSSVNGYDVSGNSLHAVFGVANYYDILYSEYGSRHTLDVGYSIYKKPYLSSPSNTNPDIKVPLTDASTALGSPGLADGYYLDSTVLGVATEHNRCDSKIMFIGANWDRSNATIYSDAARLGFYDAANPTVWDISELTNFKLYENYLNTGYKGMMALQFNDVFNKSYLQHILSFTAEKTGSDLSKVYRYCKENGIFDIKYNFSDLHIVTQNGHKRVSFRSNRYLDYSEDNGATYINSLDLNGITSIITFAWIFQNGNIMFASQTKIYYSTDNLQTYNECTTLGIDGNTFVPSIISNFTPLVIDNLQIVNGIECRVWGNYSLNPATENININIWSTVDGGVTVKSIYKFGVSEPSFDARHIHAISIDNSDSSFIIQTGDGTDTCNWLKLVLDTDTNTGVLTKIAGDNVESTPAFNKTHYKTTGFGFLNGYIYWHSDSSDPYKLGIWRCKIENIADQTKYEKVYTSDLLSACFVYKDGCFVGSCPDGKLIISTDGINFKQVTITGGNDLYAVYGGYLQMTDLDDDGYFRLDPTEATETFDTWTSGQVLQLKLDKI